MYQFRINHNNFPSAKISLWIFHMVILQLATASILNILQLHKKKPLQWKSHHTSSAFVKKQRYIPPLFQPLTNPPSYITALYTKNTASISNICSLQIRKKLRCQYAFTACTKCSNPNNSTLCSNHHNYPHLPRVNNEIH